MLACTVQIRLLKPSLLSLLFPGYLIYVYNNFRVPMQWHSQHEQMERMVRQTSKEATFLFMTRHCGSFRLKWACLLLVTFSGE